jgi:dihydroneopterin aldolase
MEDRILLEGITLYGRHGVLEAERALGQRFVVDLELSVDLTAAGRSDDLAQTVDYGEVHRQVRAVVEGPPVNLIETVAERVATAILERHPRVEAVRVKVSKPDVRLEGAVAGGSAVQIVRRR